MVPHRDACCLEVPDAQQCLMPSRNAQCLVVHSGAWCTMTGVPGMPCAWCWQGCPVYGGAWCLVGMPNAWWCTVPSANHCLLLPCSAHCPVVLALPSACWCPVPSKDTCCLVAPDVCCQQCPLPTGAHKCLLGPTAPQVPVSAQSPLTADGS